MFLPLGDDGSQGGKRLFIFVLKSVAANCPLAVASVVGNGTIIGIRVVVAWAVVGAIKNAISTIHLLQSIIKALLLAKFAKL